MSLWAVGRYLPWAVTQAWVDDETCEVSRLLPLTQAILERVNDRNKRVQQFACSTLSIYCETCCDADYDCGDAFRSPNLRPILECLVAALAHYQVRKESRWEWRRCFSRPPHSYHSSSGEVVGDNVRHPRGALRVRRRRVHVSAQSAAILPFARFCAFPWPCVAGQGPSAVRDS